MSERLLRVITAPLFVAPKFPAVSRVRVPYDQDGQRIGDGEPRMWLDLSNGAQIRITPGHNIQGAKQPAFMHIGAEKPKKLKGGGTRHPGSGVGTVRARDAAATCKSTSCLQSAVCLL